MLKEVGACHRLGTVHHPINPLWEEAMQPVKRAGSQLGLDVSSIDVTDATKIEHTLELCARRSTVPLIVPPEQLPQPVET